MNLNGKSFLTLLDFTPDEITGLLRPEGQKEGRRPARHTPREEHRADL